ncbi:MAG: asparagine synthase (glutamine-hydrolyzing) [Candidatus Competibacteraceae bacterium]
MSGITGIYHRDGRPVAPELLRRMTELIAHRGPDGTGYWIDGPLGMSQQMCHTTPESLHERQPLVDPAGNRCLTFDGRIDNREELQRALEQKGITRRADTDAELVLQAYACWNEDCPQRIIGDFALAIWDGPARKLFCARDIHGAKPFYYYLDKQSFFWGSELRQFVAVPTIAKRPNPGMIGEYLVNQVTSLEETLYTDILRLPPAHCLIITAERVRKVRYWDIDPAREIRYSTDREYAEHFLELFQEAVRCRLRSQAKVGACLSGGLDSSSVVGMVQSLYRAGRATDTGFETFSLVFPDLPCDESPYIQDVVDKWQLKYNYIQPLIPDYNYYVQQVHNYYDIPDPPNGTMGVPMEQLSQQKGFRILLTGLGGDEWFTGSNYCYLDLLYQGKFTSFLQQFFSSGSNIKSKFLVLKLLIKSIVPKRFKKIIHNSKRRNCIYEWIKADFARDSFLLERTDTGLYQERFKSFSQADIYRMLVYGWRIHSMEIEERRASWSKIEYRSPFNDQRLVEFAFALPNEQYWRANKIKFILRNAMQKLLPETVRQRTSKAEFAPVFMQAMTTQITQKIFSSPSCLLNNCIDSERVRSMYEETYRLYAMGRQKYIFNLWTLWNILAIYLWLNTLFPTHSQSK